jgi:hypothetical protein
LLPTTIELLAGVTANDTRTGAVTVKVVEPVTDPELACMLVLPVPTVLARPALLIVATVAFDELHVTELLRSCVLPSLYVPVAVNCCVRPLATDPLAGVTESDTRLGGL